MLTLGCGPESGKIYVDRNFTTDQRLAIEEAVKDWHDSTNGAAHVELIYETVDIDEDEDDTHVKMISVNKNDVRLEFSGDYGEHKNYYKGFRMKTEILIRNDLEEEGVDHDQLRRIVIHELGHYFGLSHVKERTAVMYAHHNTVQPNCLTKSDIAAFAATMDMSIDDMHWCMENLCLLI